MSDIALARRRIREIAQRLVDRGNDQEANELRNVVAGLMHRRTAVRRMSINSRRVTPAVRERIIELAESTDLHSAEIAAEVGVNPGRVSEVLHGDR